MRTASLFVLGAVGLLVALVLTETYESPPRPASLGAVQLKLPATAKGSAIPFGRYAVPLPRVAEYFPEHKFFELKRFHYCSVDTPNFFLGMATVTLSYVGNGFIYVVNKASGEKFEFTSLSPLGRAVQFAPSSVSGCTEWRSGAGIMRACFRGPDKAYSVHADIDVVSSQPLMDPCERCAWLIAQLLAWMLACSTPRQARRVACAPTSICTRSRRWRCCTRSRPRGLPTRTRFV